MRVTNGGILEAMVIGLSNHLFFYGPCHSHSMLLNPPPSLPTALSWNIDTPWTKGGCGKVPYCWPLPDRCCQQTSDIVGGNSASQHTRGSTLPAGRPWLSLTAGGPPATSATHRYWQPWPGGPGSRPSCGPWPWAVRHRPRWQTCPLGDPPSRGVAWVDIPIPG